MAKRKLTRRQFVQALGLGAVAGVATSNYCSSCAEWLEVEYRELRLPLWDADGFKIAFIADLHANSDSETERAVRSVEMALKAKPDLCIVGGDFVNHSAPVTLSHLKPIFEPFAGGPPTIAVLGNHDYACAEPRLLIDAIRHSPIRLLRNQLFEIDGVTIAGIDDATEGFDRYDFFPENKVSKSCLALLHEPDFVDRMPSHVSVQLSGHTHGGQVCLPFGIALHTPRGGRKYISGYYENTRVPLYVTRGVGTVGVDYRLFCRPEVTVLTLRSA